MSFQGICLALSGILAIVAYVPYIRGILKRTTVPEKATWLVWWIVDSTGLASMLSQGALNWQMPAAVAGCTVTSVLAFRYGKSGWTRLDVLCLALAALGIVVWMVSGNPGFGLLSFAVCNWLGFLPTLRTAWIKPETQKNPTWGINFVSSALALAGMPGWSIAHATAPLTFFVMSGVILLVLYRPRKTQG